MQKLQAASALVHTRHAPGQCARASYIPCFHAWKANCWLSMVNSHARSASAVRARTTSVVVNDRSRREVEGCWVGPTAKTVT